jgi:hypothetical protein
MLGATGLVRLDKTEKIGKIREEIENCQEKDKEES